MGLTMKGKRELTAVKGSRYRKASKNEKHKILDDFLKDTGYNRKYAIHLLANWGKQKLCLVKGKPVRLIVGIPRERKRRVGKPLYGPAVKKALRKIWELFDYMCGKRLGVLIRLNIAVLARQADLGVDKQVRQKLLHISPATIDRILAPQRKRLQLKGRSHTRAGGLLKNQIPIRVFFDWDERKPGFFELDTVAHDGGNSTGHYCFTLCVTDVYSGWVELRALPNQAHRWVKEAAEQVRGQLPFRMKGIDSDNGGEFINHQLLDWAKEKHIQFTRGRPYRKNDNCFVEQNNGDVVRRVLGYDRFISEAEYRALQNVYKHLCPLLNFCYPSMKIVSKMRVGSKVKKTYDPPKPPCQRLLESPDLEAAAKAKLRMRFHRIDIVKQKRLVDQAVARLIRTHRDRVQSLLPLE